MMMNNYTYCNVLDAAGVLCWLYAAFVLDTLPLLPYCTGIP
jgi:hypothetical protein